MELSYINIFIFKVVKNYIILRTVGCKLRLFFWSSPLKLYKVWFDLLVHISCVIKLPWQMCWIGSQIRGRKISYLCYNFSLKKKEAGWNLSNLRQRPLTSLPHIFMNSANAFNNVHSVWPLSYRITPCIRKLFRFFTCTLCTR